MYVEKPVVLASLYLQPVFVNMVYWSLQGILKTINTKITNNYILNFLLQFSSAKYVYSLGYI